MRPPAPQRFPSRHFGVPVLRRAQRGGRGIGAPRGDGSRCRSSDGEESSRREEPESRACGALPTGRGRPARTELVPFGRRCPPAVESEATRPRRAGARQAPGGSFPSLRSYREWAVRRQRDDGVRTSRRRRQRVRWRPVDDPVARRGLGGIRRRVAHHGLQGTDDSRRRERAHSVRRGTPSPLTMPVNAAAIAERGRARRGDADDAPADATEPSQGREPAYRFRWRTTGRTASTPRPRRPT